ncbi:MAG: peptidase M13 [Actinobacteria bacterium]|nr:peptidase M13 [Actinomycetota bacterium]
MNPAIRPQDDLFRHFAGTWLDTYEIPADRASDGVSRALYDIAEVQVREIIETAQGSDEAQKISDLFKSFMDTDAIKARGMTPLAEDLEAVDAITDRTSFIATMARLEKQGLSGIFGAGIYADAMDSSMNIFHIAQGGISLPDEAYYREEQYQPIREAFLEHVRKMGELAGVPLMASEILALETEIATHHWDQVKDRDATLTYNRTTRAELEALAPNLLWDLWAENSEIPAIAFDVLNIHEPSFFAGISSMLADFDSRREVWLSWLRWSLISGSAAFLTEEIVQQNFSFYGTTLSGTPEIRERWKRGVSLVQGSLGEAIGKVYVGLYFPAQAKSEMLTLVDYLIQAFELSIKELPWLTDVTKAKALEKLQKFTPKIGYPDKWRDYSTLEIKGDDLIGNLQRIAAFGHAYEVAKIGKPVDRDEWHMTPQTVNAYYSPLMNEIVFPAAILQAPFFSLEVDIAANYGGIGSVIGHEIAHGFDDQGSKYDGDGNMFDWWSQSDREAFEALAAKLIEQFDALSPAETPDTHVNGAFTVGENIGDLSGLEIAYKAYKLALKGQDAPVIDGWTGDQRFFLSYAQAWRGKNRPEETRRRIATDPHSPDEFRCNQIVRNLAQFHSAFDVSESDRMWLAPSERVRIW